MLEQFLTAVRDLLQEYFNLDVGVEFLGRVIQTFLILLFLWAVRGMGYRLVNRQFRQNPRLLYNWRKVVQYVTVIVGMILVGRIWLAGVDTLVTYLGLVSAGIAIALQDPIVSIAGWVFIVWRRPFAVGDRIEIDNIMGDVIDVRVFAFSLLEVGKRIDAEQSTGRIIHIPNGMVFKLPLVNTHQGYPFIWNEIPVMVTFESDWEKAKSILNNIIHELAPDVKEGIRQYEKRPDRFVITYSSLEPTVYTQVANSGVVLTMRYLVDPRRKRGSEHEIWESILRAFKLHWDIDFAYPTQREFLHFHEGAKPPSPAPQEEPTVVSRKPWMTSDTGFRPVPPLDDE
ncbi:MAG: mechanosensitive ion channel family protein [Anaerolineae bacterium]|nr:mechanosensitive ion channel family protein [Anaerolineae bacterium]